MGGILPGERRGFHPHRRWRRRLRNPRRSRLPSKSPRGFGRGTPDAFGARMRTWALAAVLLTTQGCRGGAALPASPEAGPGGGDATAGGADRPAADGPAASDGGATADAGGDNCFGQICPPGTVCCGGCAPGTGACYSGGCPGAACPPPPLDGGGATDA